MRQEILTYALLAGLVLAALALGAAARNFHLPDNHQGYEPVQPIAYSHRLHAGELGIDCMYCHFGAESSQHAGIPATNICMNCHHFVTAPLGVIRAEEDAAAEDGRDPARVVSPELAKLYEFAGLNADMQPDPDRAAQPIPWIKVHNLPEHVYFDHRAHVNAGVACQSCHGPVETMERVRQVETLAMGWCIDCHRTQSPSGMRDKPLNATTDCSTCHY
jgi:hypothetical protein